MITTPEYDVAIVGAGPVGLLLANLLADRGFRVFIGEQRAAPPVFSMAIGVTPPSLQILAGVGLDLPLISSGVRIRTARVFEGRQEVGTTRFDCLPDPYRFILSVPQSTTTQLLESAAHLRPNILVRRGLQFLRAEQSHGKVSLRFLSNDQEQQVEVTARLAVGCDGSRSVMREQLAVGGDSHVYPQRWVMGDFPDTTRFANEARLYFSADGPIESFPLPGNIRRWVVQLPDNTPVDPHEFLRSRIAERLNYTLAEPLNGFSLFQSSRFTARAYGRGRILLCGDAAHVMSSVGGQGMNVGFGDALVLGQTIPDWISTGGSCEGLAETFTKIRRPAAVSAARRAEISMWVGTGRGVLFSYVRQKFLARILRFDRGNDAIARHFAMLTLPGNAWLHLDSCGERPGICA